MSTSSCLSETNITLLAVNMNVSLHDTWHQMLSINLVFKRNIYQFYALPAYHLSMGEIYNQGRCFKMWCLQLHMHLDMWMQSTDCPTFSACNYHVRLGCICTEKGSLICTMQLHMRSTYCIHGLLGIMFSHICPPEYCVTASVVHSSAA